jgi:hypothetical protein
MGHCEKKNANEQFVSSTVFFVCKLRFSSNHTNTNLMESDLEIQAPLSR